MHPESEIPMQRSRSVGRRALALDGSKMMVMMGIDGDVSGKSKNSVRSYSFCYSGPGSTTQFRAGQKITINPLHHHHKWNFHLAFSTHHVAAPPRLLG